MEPGCALLVAFRPAIDVEVGVVGPETDGTGGGEGAAEAVIAITEAGGAMSR